MKVGRSMRTAIAISIALSALVQAGLDARATAAPKAGTVNPCKLLESVFREVGAGIWVLRLREHIFSEFGPGYRCEWTSKPIKGTVHFRYQVLLYFLPARTPAIARQNLASLKGKSKPLRGTGADEAFGSEMQSPGATSSRIAWRKGSYGGWLSVTGPGQAGDLEDASDLLKGLMRRIPRN